MTFLIQTVMFLLGMVLCVQWVAALFGLVDCRYAAKTLYPRVIRNILVWSGIIVLVTLLAGDAHRSAFLWGVAVFPFFHVASFAGGKALIRLKTLQ